LLVSGFAVPLLPRIPLFAAFAVLCSCGALVPQNPTQGEEDGDEPTSSASSASVRASFHAE